MSAQVYDFGDALGAGFDEMLQEGRGYRLEVVKFKDIKVSDQVREQMEDESSTLEEMGGSIKQHGYLQTLLLRPIGGPIPYELVAGERRLISGTKVGETEGPCLIKEMTDEEKDDIQLAENIHRKNLTQIEEAKKVQRDLDAANGDVEAVMAKHHKGRSWVSKMIGLLNLSEQARRLLTEKVSADVEVIGMVKQIEKVNPEAAKNLVDDLAATRGKEDARKKASAVKDQVKPPKAKPQEPAAAAGARTNPPAGAQSSGNFADAKTEPAGAWPFPTSSRGVGTTTAPAKSDAAAGAGADADAQPSAPTRDLREVLSQAYGLVSEHGTSARMFLSTLEAGDRAAVEEFLLKHYQAGSRVDDTSVPREVMLGLRTRTFEADGTGCFAMMAFLNGFLMVPFDVERILTLAKP